MLVVTNCARFRDLSPLFGMPTSKKSLKIGTKTRTREETGYIYLFMILYRYKRSKHNTNSTKFHLINMQGVTPKLFLTVSTLNDDIGREEKLWTC